MHHVKAAAEQNYTGTMLGSSVVPPTDSAATGLVIMRHDDHAMHCCGCPCSAILGMMPSFSIRSPPRPCAPQVPARRTGEHAGYLYCERGQPGGHPECGAAPGKAVQDHGVAAHLRCSAQYPTLHALLQAASGHEGDQVVTLYGPVNNSGSQACNFLSML